MIQLREQYWAVEVPDYGHSFEIIKDECDDFVIAYKGKSWLRDDEYMIINLPPGTWEIVCTSKEATPLQASEIVDHCWVENTNGDEQMNCLGGNGIWFNDPLIALRSLLTSKGCDLKNNYLILKNTL